MVAARERRGELDGVAAAREEGRHGGPVPGDPGREVAEALEARAGAPVAGLGAATTSAFVKRSELGRFPLDFWDERSSLGANAKRGCFSLGHRFENNTHVEATSKRPFSSRPADDVVGPRVRARRKGEERADDGLKETRPSEATWAGVSHPRTCHVEGCAPANARARSR